MFGKNKHLRFETILEILEEGPVPIAEILENLEEDYSENHIFSVLSKMKDKEYLSITKEQFVKKEKDLFYNEL